MKMKKIYIAMLLSLMIATPALADNTRKAYIAADLGRAAYVPAYGFDSTGMARIAGGYHFSQFIAAEIGYTKISDVTATYTSGTYAQSTTSLHAVAIGSYPLTPKFDLTAKLGVSQNTTTGKATGGVVITGANPFITTSVMHGVGVQYHLTSRVSIRGQYEDYGAINSTSPTVNMTAFSAGVMYNF
jgi:OOP family OmpA-OmpF porin